MDTIRVELDKEEKRALDNGKGIGWVIEFPNDPLDILEIVYGDVRNLDDDALEKKLPNSWLLLPLESKFSYNLLNPTPILPLPPSIPLTIIQF